MSKPTQLNEIGVQLAEKLHSLWTEKYRPTTLDELVCSKELRNFVSKCIDDQDIPNLLLFGKPGTGKNSLVNVVLNNIQCISLVINASEERGIDTIRDKVQTFALSAAWGNKLKIVVLNEADGLNYTAQDSLRELMETASKNCRFILTCNQVSRISDPIRSRCNEFEIGGSTLDVARRLTEILDTENVPWTEDFIVILIKKYGTDLRKMINEIQKFSKMYSKLDENVSLDNSSHYNDFFDKLFSTNDVKKISDLTRKMVFDEDIYSSLKDYIIKKYADPNLIIIVADHAYRSKIVVDKDLMFLSCIFNIKDIMKG